MGRKYVVSVIMPVYNCSEFLENSVNSILNQTYDLSKIEIILINDGSTDNSAKICKRLAKNNKNINYVEQNNSGVSSARNKGLDVAQGLYVMFLDGDDVISKNTVENLVNFLDKEKEVNIAFYSLYYSYIGNKVKNKSHIFSSIIKKTGVYDLNNYPHLTQSTVNIIIRKNTLRFNEEMNFSEDEEFNIKNIMINRKIGYVANANYYYLQYSNSSSVTTKHPYYNFEILIKYLFNIIEKYKNTDGTLPYVIQGYILKNLRWRIEKDLLFPYHYNEKDFLKAKSKIYEVIKYIDVSMIYTDPFMDIYHKFMLYKIKNILFNFKMESPDYEIRYNNFLIYKNRKIEIVVTDFNFKNNHINIMGFVKSPLNDYYKPKLYLHNTNINGNEELDLKLFKSNHSHYKSKMETASFYGFNTKIKINETKKFKFIVNYDNHNFDTKYLFLNNENYNFNRGLNYLIYKNKKLSFLGDSFKIEDINKIDKIKLNYKTDKLMSKNFKKRNKRHFVKIFMIRNISRIFKKKNIWLYSDRGGEFDNAYYQFKHDLKIKDNIKKYYVYDDDINDIKDKFNKNELKYLIKRKSLKHKILFVSSSKVLTSFLPRSFYTPFNSGIKNYQDLLSFELVYLQHGVLHCHTPWLYSKEKNKIDKVVVSSSYEIENFKKNYNFQDDNFITSGMPRFDKLKPNSMNVENKKILFAPTWRSNLIGNLDKDNNRELQEDNFIKSEYYLQISSLIKSKELNDLLKKNKIIFDFKLHPVFKEYLYLFEDTSNIKVNADEINLTEYNLCITDYSSFVFDFVYLNIPILYFLPDKEKFEAGFHIYRKLDLPLKEAFGNITLNSKKLIFEIEKMIKNDFKADTKYQNRMNSFFLSKDNHCEQLYNQLIENIDCEGGKSNEKI